MKVILPLVLLSAVVAGLIWHSGFSVADFHQLRSRLDLAWLPLSLSFHFLIILIGALKWKLLASELIENLQVSLLDFFHFLVLGLVSSLFLTQAGNVAVRGARFVKERDVPAGKGFYSVFIDQLIDLLSLGLFIAPAILFQLKLLSGWEAFWLMVAISVAVLTGLGIVWRNQGERWLIDGYNFLACWLARQKRQPAPQQHGVGRGCVIQSLALGLGCGVALSLRFLVLGYCLGIDVGYKHLFFGLPLIQLAIFLSFIPGGFGIAEAGLYTLLLNVGVASEDAFFFVTAERILMISELIVMLAVSHHLHRRRGWQGRVVESGS